MSRDVVGQLSALAAGRLVPSRIGRAPVVLMLLGDRPVAVASRCPHQGADLAAGQIVDRVEANGRGCLVADPHRPVLRCPWHGFEFDLATGEPLVPSPDHRRLRLRMWELSVEGDDLVVAT